VFLEATLDPGFDREMTGGVDDPVLVEGDLDAGIQRDVGPGGARQRPDDPQRLVGLERPE
jgi:hypothetical protein